MTVIIVPNTDPCATPLMAGDDFDKTRSIDLSEICLIRKAIFTSMECC